jgi:hypothetical protein
MEEERGFGLGQLLSQPFKRRICGTERRVSEVTGANGGAVQVEAKGVDTDALSPDQRSALRDLILAAKAAAK